MSTVRHIGPGADITQPPYDTWGDTPAFNRDHAPNPEIPGRLLFDPRDGHPMTGHPLLEAQVRTQIAGMTPLQRQAAMRVQDQLASILHGLSLKSPDPNIRLSIAQHIAGLQPELGINPQAITLSDVTDKGLSEHLSALMALKDELGLAKSRRESAWRRGAPGEAVNSPIGGGNMRESSSQEGLAAAGAQPNAGVQYLGVAR